MKEIDIKSSTIEKGMELAADFANRLIGPSVDEVGLLLADNVKFVRFKRQVNILLKAKKYVESKGINPKEIPLKILVPLLENASLEEDEDLKDKWAVMITNLADSNKNLQNQVFPYLLGQISIEEYSGLKDLLDKEFVHRAMRRTYGELEDKDEIRYHITDPTKKKQLEVLEIEQNGFRISLENYELSNLERLGLIKRSPPPIVLGDIELKRNYDTDRLEEYQCSKRNQRELFNIVYIMADPQYKIFINQT
jgi:hypothetical protein